MLWTPPVPVVVDQIVVQALPSALVWSWNALPYAASQLRTTRHTVAEVPRSTRIHCGSANALDHRVVVLPSTAADGPVDAFSLELAAVARPRASFAVRQPGVLVPESP